MPLCAGIIAAMTYSPAGIDKWWLAEVMISIQIDGWIFKFISEQCFSLIICLQNGLSLTLTSIDATANMVVTTSQCLLIKKTCQNYRNARADPQHMAFGIAKMTCQFSKCTG